MGFNDSIQPALPQLPLPVSGFPAVWQVGLSLPLWGEAGLALIRFSVTPTCLLFLRLADQAGVTMSLFFFVHFSLYSSDVWERRGKQMDSVCHVEPQVCITPHSGRDAGMSTSSTTCRWRLGVLCRRCWPLLWEGERCSQLRLIPSSSQATALVLTELPH